MFITYYTEAEIDADERKQSTRDLAGRRKTIANLEKQRFKKKEVDNLESNFKRNFRSFAISNKDFIYQSINKFL
jgi:hypothetical protein